MIFDPRKRDRKRPNIGLPSNSNGSDGDIELYLTPKGLALYGKFNGEWYPFAEAQEKGIVNKDIKSFIEVKNSLSIKNQGVLKLFNSANKYFSSFKNSDSATENIEYTLPVTGYSDAGMYLSVGATNRLAWKPVGDVLTDLGITGAEILDWTSDQGSSNIHASNFVNLTPSGTLNISTGTLTTSAAQNKSIVEGVGANTDIGAYEFRAQTFQSDATTISGSSPFTVASTIKVANLNADKLDGADLIDEDDMSSNSATKIPTQQSVKAYVDTEVSGLVDSAPGALDTLNELAAALGDDASFATTVTNSIATKVSLTGIETLTGRKTINTSFPQLSFTDDSNTDYVQIGLSGNTYYHKTSDTGINFGWRDNSNNDVLSIDTSAKTLTIGESAQETYALKVGDNGRMNMPQRGLEFENAHGYFSPLGDMHMPLYINVTQTDLIRFQTPITWEYYDYSGSAWVDDSSNVSNLQNMLDGRRGTNYAVSNTKRKFRFVIQRSSSWADDHLFYIENTWSSIGTWTSSASGGGSLTPTMVVERLDGSFDASDDSNNDWTTNSGITTDWHTTGIWNAFGLGMYYSTGMHNTETHIRITVTFPEYADASKEINIKNIGVMSSYSSQNTNQDAFVQDFNRNLTGYGSISIPTGDTYKINATTVLSGNGLGSGIINSSLTSLGTISTGVWQGTAIASAYLDSDTAHLSGTQTFSGAKTFSSPVTIHTSSDAMFNLKTADGWAYMQFLENDGTRRAYIGMDADLDRLILNATENGANEIEINTTTVDINANVDISGTITNAEWNGDVIASAYLDSDTAHLTTTQTFSGAKTFGADTTFSGHIILDADNKIKSDTSGTWNFIEFDDDSGSPGNQTLISSVTNVAAIVDGNNNGTGHFEVLKGGTDATATELFRIENDGDAVFTGNLSVGDNNITNVGDIALDTISSDAGTSIGVTLGTDAGDDFNVGSGKLVVEGDTGEVGIGTASPTATLHISDASNSGVTSLSLNDRVKVRGDGVVYWGSAAAHGTLSWDSGKTLIYSQGTNDLQISAGNAHTDHIYIDGSGSTNDGCVGIGTNSPSWKLHVSGSLYATSTFRTNGVILQQERAAASGSYATLGQIWTKNDAPNNLYFTDDAGTDIAITNNGALANAPTATVATTVTITDNESTDENNAIIFAAGADTDGGNLGLESDGNFTYNPSDATINAGKLNLSGSGVNITNDSATELNFNGTNNTNITTAGNMYIKAGSSKKMYLGANATDSLVTLDTNGFVGIGNTGPNHLLHVGDDVTASFGTTPDKAIQLSSSTNDHEIAYILYAGEGTNNIRSKYYVDDATKYVGWDSTHSTGWLGYEWKIAGSQSMKLDTSGNLTLSGAITSDGDVFIPSGNALQLADASDHTKIERSTGLQFYTNSAARLNILDSGNVGIGTTSPSTELEVDGTITATGFVAGTGGLTINEPNPLIVMKDTTDDDDHQIQFQDNSGNVDYKITTAGDIFNIHAVSNVPVAFHTNNTERLRILGDGKVGIGTDSPDSTLHVKGAGSDNSTTSFEVDDSTGQNLFYVRDDGVVSITHGYLFAQHSNGIYSTGSIKARGGVTDDGGPLGLGSDGNVDHLVITSGNITTGVWNGTAITHDYIGADAIDGTNIGDDVINSEHYVDGSIDTAHIADDQVTYAKIQNVSATDRILGRDSAGAGVIEEITPANLRTMLNVADGATANAGDITRVKLIGDSGDYTINSGNADIRFQGAASYIQTEVDDTTVIFDLASSSSSAKGIVELATTAETTTGTDATRAVTPDGLKDSGYMGHQFRHIINAGFNYNLTAGTRVFIPLVGYVLEWSSSSSRNEYISFVAPYDGKLNQVIFRSEEACGDTVVGLHKSSTGTEFPSNTASESITVNMATDDTPYKFAFTGGAGGSDNQFSAGQILAISFDPTNDANDTVFTVEFIFDSSAGL